MDGYLAALALAALPALGNFAGGLISEVATISGLTLSRALHLAAGIVLAVVGIELMPEALASARPWVPVLAFMLGGAFFMLIERALHVVQVRYGGKATAGPWAIFFGVAVDLFSDGVMIGTGSTLSLGLGLLLALGQVSADIPEGFATIASFKHQGIARGRRLLLAASFIVPIALGATIGYWAVRGQPPLVKLSLLAFTAGILLTVVVEEIVGEAHELPEPPLAALWLTSGFALFALLSAYFD